MSKFIVTLDFTVALETVDVDTRLFQLTRDFHCTVNNLPIVIPAGFPTDLASVPAATKWIIDDDAPYILRAAVLHDYLYQHQGLVGVTFTRSECDSILSSAMKCCRASWSERALVYTAVRIGGWWAWNNHSERKAAIRVTLATSTDTAIA